MILAALLARGEQTTKHRKLRKSDRDEGERKASSAIVLFDEPEAT